MATADGWQIFKRDGYRCRTCGRAGRLECDHIRGHGGGLYDPDNLQSLCRACHFEKTRVENGGAQIAGRSEWTEYVRQLERATMA